MQPYTHYTLDQRESLRVLLEDGKSFRYIAKLLGKNVSSISREMKRKSNKDGSYNAWQGTCLYIQRRKKCKRKLRLRNDLPVTKYIIEKLKIFWSLELITVMYKKDYLAEKSSYSTIYAAIKKKTYLELQLKTI